MSYARNGQESSRYDHSVSDIRIAVIGEELNTLKSIVKDLAVMVDHLRQKLEERPIVDVASVSTTPRKLRSPRTPPVPSTVQENDSDWKTKVMGRIYPYRYIVGAGVGLGLGWVGWKGWQGWQGWQTRTV